MTTDAGLEAPAKTPIWRDLRFLRIVGQAVVVLFVGLILFFLWSNLQAKADAGQIPQPTDLSYLNQPIGQSISGSDLRATQSRLDALVVGVQRTIQIAIVGIVLTTILGVLLGIARLSKNWLTAKFAAVYVEVFRNTPPLVVILFIFLGAILGGIFPNFQSENTFEIPHLLTANTRATNVPWITVEGSALMPALLLLGAVVLAFIVRRWRIKKQDVTGTPARSGLWFFGTLVGVFAVGWIALGGPVGITTPTVADDGRTVSGGYRMQAAYLALLLGLVLYTASHIAEITRASIQAVAKGQDEAAMALGLAPGQRLQRVILPQAMRVAIPPLANQYLNLTKNSSLAIVIAYVEATKITGDIVSNGGPAFQSYSLLLLIYLAISLAISAFTNFVNARLAIPGR